MVNSHEFVTKGVDIMVSDGWELGEKMKDAYALVINKFYKTNKKYYSLRFFCLFHFIFCMHF